MRSHLEKGSRRLATLSSLAFALLLASGTPTNGGTPDPADSSAPVPELRVETGLEGYRPFTEAPIKDWDSALREAYEGAVEMGLPGTYARPRPADPGHGRPGAGNKHGHHHQ